MIGFHIITGFLGAGKTTFINKLLKEGAAGEKSLLVENEYGDIAIDTDCISSDIQVLEITSGCICCSLSGNFVEGIIKLSETYHPEQIFIEPTGAGDLSNMITACEQVCEQISGRIESVISIVNAEALPALLMMGGEFFHKQIEDAKFIVMSCVQDLDKEELEESQAMLEEVNDRVPVHWEPWDELDSMQVLMEACETYLPSMSMRAGKTAGKTAQKIRFNRSLSEGVKNNDAPVFNADSISFMPKNCYIRSEAMELITKLTSGDYGKIWRAKGFLKSPEGGCWQINYVFGTEPRAIPCDYQGDAKMIVIGEALSEDNIASLLQ